MVKEKPLLTFSLFYLVDYVLHSYRTQKILEILVRFSLWYKTSNGLQSSQLIPVIKIDQAIWYSMEIKTLRPNFHSNKPDQL